MLSPIALTGPFEVCRVAAHLPPWIDSKVGVSRLFMVRSHGTAPPEAGLPSTAEARLEPVREPDRHGLVVEPDVVAVLAARLALAEVVEGIAAFEVERGRQVVAQPRQRIGVALRQIHRAALRASA